MVAEKCKELFGHARKGNLRLPTMAGIIAAGPPDAEDNHSFTSNHTVHPSPDTLTSMFTTNQVPQLTQLF